MIKNRKHSHIGMATSNLQQTTKWYQEILGCDLIGQFKDELGNAVHFLTDGTVTFEIYEQDKIKPEVWGKIDHYAYESLNIEEDYIECVNKRYEISTNGIESINTFWDNGVKFFKIKAPTGQEIEFCQII